MAMQARPNELECAGYVAGMPKGMHQKGGRQDLPTGSLTASWKDVSSCPPFLW